MKTNTKKIFAVFSAIIFSAILFPNGTSASSKVVYPLKKVSKLECRYSKFSELKSDCLEDLEILKTKNYGKYSKQNGGYNKFTRRYTVLWGASYKYGWDVGSGGHMGVDIATSEGTPVYSMADGIVIVSGWKTGFGNTVSVRHKIDGKTIVSSYAHLSKIIAKKGQKVNAGTLIGEVGTTGNSTGNHLHFQIDTKTTYSPIYYNYKTCPYSYYKITEEGLCFNELTKITLDPLKFLETNGKILDHVTIKKNTVTKNTSNKKTTKKNKKTTKKVVRKTIKTNASIFDTTVYRNNSYGEIREVQTIYKSLGYYKGEINGRYKDVEESIIKYQLEKGVIANRNIDGAGYFGPKTRAQTKKDWKKFLANGGKVATTEIIIGGEDTTEVVEDNRDYTDITSIENDANVTVGENVVNIKVEKIARKNLMTTKEREERAVKEFLDNFNVNLQFANPGGSVEKGKTEVLKLKVTDKRGKPFKGNMPGAMRFIVNTAKVKTFPAKLYFFTNGKRDIQITGLQEGTTTLYVKIGEVTLKQFRIKVYNGNKTIYPTSSVLYVPRTAIMGQNTKGLALFKDNNNRNLINIPFGSTFKLKASDGNKVCIKKAKGKNMKSVYNSNCNNFSQEATFTYADTVSGILFFDIQVLNKNANFEIVNTYNNANMVAKKVKLGLPKGLAKTYKYKNEVLQSLELGITNKSMKRGYFMQERKLTEAESYAWIENTLNVMKNNNNNSSLITNINKNLHEVQKRKLQASKNHTLTRGELLALTYKYLVFNGASTDIHITYKDLDEGKNKVANAIFNQENTWKDRFGKTHFQPNEELTKGEGVYLLMKALEKKDTHLVTKR